MTHQRLDRRKGVTAWRTCGLALFLSVGWIDAATPVAPVGLAATVRDGGLTLQWEPTVGAVSYVVRSGNVSGGPYAVVASGVTDRIFDQAGLTNGLTYFYVLSAVNADGEGAPSAELAAVPFGPPVAVRGLSAAAISSTQVSVGWIDPTKTVTSHTIERQRLGEGVWTIVGTTTAGAMSFLDESIEAGASYQYRVVAFAGDLPCAPGTSAIVSVPINVAALPLENLETWLRADGALDLVNGGVALWADSGPKAMNATQDVAGSRPSVAPGAVNGNPGVHFNGTTQHLRLPSGFTDLGAGFSAFVVVRPTGIGPFERYFDFGNGPGLDNIILARDGATPNVLFITYGGGGVAVAGENAIRQDQAQMFEVTQAFGRAELLRNARTLRLSTFGTPDSVERDFNYVGRSNWPVDAYLNADICEMLIFSRQLGEVDRRAIEDYLNRKYALYPSAPTGVAVIPGDSQATLSWNTTGTGDRYVVKRSPSFDGLYGILQAAVVGTNYTDTGLTNGSVYYYRVSVAKPDAADSLTVVARPVQAVAATPVIAPNGSLWLSAFNATISCATPGATLRYTLSGRDPIASDPAVIGGVVNVDRPGVLKVRAFASGLRPSAIASAAFPAASDVGNTGLRGATTLNAGSESVVQSGAGLGAAGAQDSLQFAGWYLSNFGQVIVRVAALSNIPAARAGVILRDGLNPGAAELGIVVGADGVHVVRRLSAGSNAIDTLISDRNVVPQWLKLVRRNAECIVFYSDDGTNWLLAGAEVLPMAAPLAGLVTASGSTSLVAEAGFDHFRIEASDLVQLTAGRSHSVALKGDGTVWIWGSTDPYGGGIPDDFPTRVLGLDRVIAICAGVYHTAALRSDGTIWTWGNGWEGVLGDRAEPNGLVPAPVLGVSDVVGIAAGALHTMALRRDRTVLAWGWNTGGQLADGTNISSSHPRPIPGINDAIAIASASVTSFALGRDGRVWAWGNSTSVGNGVPNPPLALLPVHVVNLDRVRVLVAGLEDVVVRREGGDAWGWGDNYYSQLGGQLSYRIGVPIPLIDLDDFTSVAIGERHLVWRDRFGTVRARGANASGQLGSGVVGGAADIPVGVVVDGDLNALAAGPTHTLASTVDGGLLSWGNAARMKLAYGGLDERYGLPRVPSSSLSAVLATNGNLGLSWNYFSWRGDQLSFVIERRPLGSGESGWLALGTAQQEESGYVDANPPAGAPTEYRIRPMFADGAAPGVDADSLSIAVNFPTAASPARKSAPAGATITTTFYGVGDTYIGLPVIGVARGYWRVAAAGVIAGTGPFVRVADALPFTPNELVFNPGANQHAHYYLLVRSGALAGLTFDVIGNDPTQFLLEPAQGDPSLHPLGGVLAGDVVSLHRHATIDTLFRDNAGAPVIDATTSAFTAPDCVSLFSTAPGVANPAPQLDLVYLAGFGWHRSGSADGTSFVDTVIQPFQLARATRQGTRDHANSLQGMLPTHPLIATLAAPAIDGDRMMAFSIAGDLELRNLNLWQPQPSPLLVVRPTALQDVPAAIGDQLRGFSDFARETSAVSDLGDFYVLDGSPDNYGWRAVEQPGAGTPYNLLKSGEAAIIRRRFPAPQSFWSIPPWSIQD